MLHRTFHSQGKLLQSTRSLKLLTMCFQKKVFYVHGFKSTSNDKFVADAQTDILCPVNTVSNPCQMTPYVNITLLKDLTRPYLQVIGKDAKLDRVVLEQTVNICRITKSPGLDILLKLLLELVKDNINFQITCPFKKVTQSFVVS
jgi:hypothetical protein